ALRVFFYEENVRHRVGARGHPDDLRRLSRSKPGAMAWANAFCTSRTMASAVPTLGLSMRPDSSVLVATSSRGRFSRSWAFAPTTAPWARRKMFLLRSWRGSYTSTSLKSGFTYPATWPWLTLISEKKEKDPPVTSKPPRARERSFIGWLRGASVTSL